MCTARVLVRKSSWEQTSVQWNAASLQLCHLRREAVPVERRAESTTLLLQGCEELRESISAAVARGELPILEG